VSIARSLLDRVAAAAARRSEGDRVAFLANGRMEAADERTDGSERSRRSFA